MIKMFVAAFAALALVAPAVAADNFIVKDGSGTSITKASKDIGSGVQADKNLLVDGSGVAVGTAGNPLVSQLGAGSNIIGYVAGLSLYTYVQPTVTASSAYTSGNAVGGLLSLTSAARLAGGSGMITGLTVKFQDAQNSAYDLVLFNAAPSSSTITDKTALSVAAADFSKVIRVIHISDCTSLGTTSVCEADSLSINYALATGTTMYAALVARGTPTYGSTSNVWVEIRGTLN